MKKFQKVGMVFGLSFGLVAQAAAITNFAPSNDVALGKRQFAFQR